MPKGIAKYLRNPNLARKFDFDVRKHLHVKLFTKTKQELKIMAYRMDLSLQDIFERLAIAIIEEDPYIISILNDYKLQKDSYEANLMSETDIDSIYDILEQEEGEDYDDDDSST